MIKWFAILLVVINIAVFIGRDTLPDTQQQAASGPPAIDLQHMMLSQEVPSNASEAIEIEEQALAKVDVAAKVTNKATSVVAKAGRLEPAGMVFKIEESVADIKVPDVALTGLVEKVKSQEAVQFTKVVVDENKEPETKCYRIGPLKGTKTLGKLLGALDAAGISYKKSDQDETSKLKAARVFMGPFDTKAALSAQQSKLKAKKIDSFVLTRPEGKIIQIGYFSKQGNALQNAQAFQKQIEKKGVKVKISPEYSESRSSSVVRFEAKPARVESMGMRKMVGNSKFKLQACR